MRMTRDTDPHEIEKYAGVKPAPIFGPVRCFAKFPARRYTCTLAKGHSGAHVAHGWFKKVMAVWDDDTCGRSNG